ncbi:MAG: DUF4912 domain-containing protein [Thermoguttaceae bacterium]
MPMTPADLKTRTVRDLANLAKKQKVPGWHAMRKDELVKALLKHVRSNLSNRENQRRTGNGNAKFAPHHENAECRLIKIKEKFSQIKDLSFQTDGSGQSKDRLVVMVRDPFWLHAYWELDRRSINRARVAMNQHWHSSRPMLRLYQVLREGTIVSARKVERDIEIHGGVNNWYIDVRDPPKTFQLEIGYLSAAGRFFCLARSNVVTTPEAGKENTFDKNWSEVAKDFERIFALSGGYSEPENRGDLKEVFEERLKRPMGDTIATQFGMGEGAGANSEGKSAAPRRRHFRRPLQSARTPPHSASCRQQPQRRRTADHRSVDRSQHEDHGTHDPRSQRLKTAINHKTFLPPDKYLAPGEYTGGFRWTLAHSEYYMLFASS